MNKNYKTLIFLSLVIMTGSMSGPSLNLIYLAEGQQQQSSDIGNSKNVTDLMSLNNKNNTIQLENKTVTYFKDSTGYLVYQVSESPTSDVNNNASNNDAFPAVVLIHEWWGLNDNIKNMADLLAKEGYVVLAVDLFNNEFAIDPERASELSKVARDNPEIAISNLKSAVQYLKSLPNVNPDKIASMGWCFGGQHSLQLALNSEENPLSATVIYYGRLVTDIETISKIDWPVLGIFGEQDKSISVDTVKQFEDALNKNGITNEIYIYEDVGHAFANPSNDNYASQETQDAWEKTLFFLEKNLG